MSIQITNNSSFSNTDKTPELSITNTNSGKYKITLKGTYTFQLVGAGGGGGGGKGSKYVHPDYLDGGSGGGGGAGEVNIFTIDLEAGDEYIVNIGQGGSGGIGGTGDGIGISSNKTATAGNNGGDTVVIIKNTTYIARGGKGGGYGDSTYLGNIINGAPGLSYTAQIPAYKGTYEKGGDGAICVSSPYGNGGGGGGWTGKGYTPVDGGIATSNASNGLPGNTSTKDNKYASGGQGGSGASGVLYIVKLAST